MLGLTTHQRANERFRKEHDFRVGSEAAALALRHQIVFLETELARLQTHFDQQQALFLEHLSPVKESLPATAGSTEPLRQQTAAEILAEPATSKREMAIRARRAAQARLRELGDEVRKDMEARLALLSPQERAAMSFDATLGVMMEQAAAETEPAAAETESPTSQAEVA